MKKVLAVLLSLCLLAGLCSCSSAPIEVKKFASETEMQEYLQGIWIDTWSEDELIFFDNGIAVRWETVNGRLTDFQNTFDPLIKEQSYKGFLEMNVSDRIAELEKGWLSAEEGMTCHFKPKKGELSIGDADYTVYVGDGILYDGSSGGEFEKFSDTPSYTVPGLIEKFEEAHKNYEPPLGVFRLTAAEYAKVLRNKYFAAVTQDGSKVHIKCGSKEINYDASKGRLAVGDPKMSTSMETLVADALLVFGDAPNVPSAGELVDRFHNEGKTELHTTPTGSLYTTKTLVIDLDDAEMEILQDRRANNDGFDIVTIRF